MQLATFGRRLAGQADVLPGFRQTWVRVTDPDVLAKSGRDMHPIVSRTGDAADEIAGTVFQLTAAELDAADRYEVDDYTRIAVTLKSGLAAWVYVAA